MSRSIFGDWSFAKVVAKGRARCPHRAVFSSYAMRRGEDTAPYLIDLNATFCRD